MLFAFGQGRKRPMLADFQKGQPDTLETPICYTPVCGRPKKKFHGEALHPQFYLICGILAENPSSNVDCPLILTACPSQIQTFATKRTHSVIFVSNGIEVGVALTIVRAAPLQRGCGKDFWP